MYDFEFLIHSLLPLSQRIQLIFQNFYGFYLIVKYFSVLLIDCFQVIYFIYERLLASLKIVSLVSVIFKIALGFFKASIDFIDLILHLAQFCVMSLALLFIEFCVRFLQFLVFFLVNLYDRLVRIVYCIECLAENVRPVLAFLRLIVIDTFINTSFGNLYLFIILFDHEFYIFACLI